VDIHCWAASCAEEGLARLPTKTTEEDTLESPKEQMILVSAGKSGSHADEFPLSSGWSGDDGTKAVSTLCAPGLCI